MTGFFCVRNSQAEIRIELESAPSSRAGHVAVDDRNGKAVPDTHGKTCYSPLVSLVSRILSATICLGISISTLAQLPSVDELTENNAASWGVASADGTISIADAVGRVHDGAGSIRIITDAKADTWAWVPADRNAGWNLGGVSYVRFWVYANNPNIGFQNDAPWIRLGTTELDYVQIRPTSDLFNLARGQWHEIMVPISDSETWSTNKVGNPDLGNINFVEIHAETWGAGFQVWLDGLGFLTITDVAFKRDVLELFETWWFTPELMATTEIGPIEMSASEMNNWSSNNVSVASVDIGGKVTARKAGRARISAKFRGKNISMPVEVVAPVLPPKREQIPTELAQPAEGALWDIPVLVIRQLPTSDGVNIDTRFDSGNFTLGEITLKDMIDQIDMFDRRAKFILEEGSRFRGYGSMDTPPSLGYRVVAYITVYEPPPPGKYRSMDASGNAIHFTDYHGMFERLGVEEIVNTLGVREIWHWRGQSSADHPLYDPDYHNPLVFIRDWESNMSSPTTADISNSNRDPADLPVYDHSYVLYSQATRRTQAEVIHNHGHQLESILSHVNRETEGNTDLFWKGFVGRADDFAWQQGRAGDTHHPPNADSDYDWYNENFVESDIEDWRPDNSGSTTLMNKDHWGNLVYPWPGGADSVRQRGESQWYIYWMQNMPGRQNQIPRVFEEAATGQVQVMPGGQNKTESTSNHVMGNWWSFTGAWDQSIRAGLGLSVKRGDAESIERRGPFDVPRFYRFLNMDGDGNSDVLLRNRETGRWHINFMDSLTVKPNSGSTPISVNRDWELVGSGDFNGNGRGDVLLRNKNTGAWWMFLMKGRVRLGGTTAITRDLDWVASGIDDFDGDGNDDVLLRHRVTGRWQIIFLNARVVRPNSGPTWLFSNLVWETMGTGDFNRDGRGDILLRNKKTGRWWIFLMDGRRKSSGATQITKDLDWMMAGIGDYDGDGKDDVMLRSKSTGRWNINFMSWRVVRSNSGFTPIIANALWEMMGSGDFNGDGRDDVLLRNRVFGGWLTYLMKGRKAASGQTKITRALDWEVPIERVSGLSR